jgi:hypothetical protein
MVYFWRGKDEVFFVKKSAELGREERVIRDFRNW